MSALSLNERAFIRSALASNLRIDGRGPSDIRSIAIRFHTEGSGAVTVQIGATRVTAITTADLVAPFPDRPTEGSINLFVNFSPMASPTFEAGFQGEKGIEIARIVDRGLRESRALDTESLCVLAGEKVWSIRVDIHVLDHEGNLTDAVNLAALCALSHFRRPDVTVVGESVTIHSVEDRQPVPLAMHHLPVSCTFAFFDRMADAAASAATSSTSSATLSNSANAASQAPLLVIDPSLKEETVSDANLTVTLNVHGELCAMQKSGGVGIELAQLMQCSQVALAKTQEITALIQAKLKEDSLRHNTGNAKRPSAQPSFQPGLSKPIDAFGKIVTKPAGQHNVAGKPIEIDMNRKEDRDSDDEEEERYEDEDEEDDDAEEGEDDDGEDEDDNNSEQMKDEEEFAAVAKKLQQQQQPASKNQSASKSAASSAQKKK